MFASSRDLVRVVYRDPEHVAEQLVLLAVQRIAEPSRASPDATRHAHPDASPQGRADDLRIRSAKIARTDGAIAGTPFHAALIPGYLNYLCQEARMTLRIAALYGRDPAALERRVELLAIRGVHPSAETARDELRRVRGRPLPERRSRRRPLRVWVDSGQRLPVFGGFASPRSGRRRSRVRIAFDVVAGAAGWFVTWICRSPSWWRWHGAVIDAPASSAAGRSSSTAGAAWPGVRAADASSAAGRSSSTADAARPGVRAADASSPPPPRRSGSRSRCRSPSSPTPPATHRPQPAEGASCSSSCCRS